MFNASVYFRDFAFELRYADTLARAMLTIRVVLAGDDYQ